jgi:hypothetical protein
MSSDVKQAVEDARGSETFDIAEAVLHETFGDTAFGLREVWERAAEFANWKAAGGRRR